MNDHRGPEYEASTGLPISILILSACVITAYLFVGGAFASSGHAGMTVYLPQVADQ